MGSSIRTLASLKVTVGGTGAALPGLKTVGVHAEAHAATRLPPVKTCLHKYLVQTLSLRLQLHDAGSRDDHGMYPLSNLAALGNLGHLPQILNSGVGARPDKNLVDLDVSHFLAGLQAHVLQGPNNFILLVRVALVRWVRHCASDRYHSLRGGPPSHGGGDVGGADDHLLVKLGPLIRPEALPVLHCCLPMLRGRGHWAALQILEGLLVRCNHPCAGPGFDGHITDRHAGLHGEVADDTAGELDDVAIAAVGSDNPDNVEHDVLGGDPLLELPFHSHAQGLGRLHNQGLGGQTVLNLGGPDTEGKRPEGAVSRGVRISADHGGPRQGEPLLRPNHMYDTLPLVGHPKVCEPKILHVILKRHAL
mmetsp:Transcript_26770/g.59111  ORF Transcript_26770/g.59111 Transcript_26770/m.59111 type:complete len:363 (-) Transcript_26770:390-1478(-)